MLLRHFIRIASDAHKIPLPCAYDDGRRTARALSVAGQRQAAEKHHGAARRQERRRARSNRTICRRRSASAAGRYRRVTRVHWPRRRAIANGRPAAGSTALRDTLWSRLVAGENFWSVVCEPFKARDLTRDDVREIVHRGLQESLGSYRGLLRLFHLPEADYKRFLAFLATHDCRLPFHLYRGLPPITRPVDEPRRTAARRSRAKWHTQAAWSAWKSMREAPAEHRFNRFPRASYATAEVTSISPK